MNLKGILRICGASPSVCAIADIFRNVSGSTSSEGNCVDSVKEAVRIAADTEDDKNRRDECSTDSEWWIRAQSRLLNIWKKNVIYPAAAGTSTADTPSPPPPPQCSSCSMLVSTMLFDVPNRYAKLDSTFNISRRIGMYSFDASRKRHAGGVGSGLVSPPGAVKKGRMKQRRKTQKQ